ncbi:MAG: NAD-dependent epimerase/dehydratase family protein, partial [Actinomycetota bacterium]|nr:NAD-dependent epimerase/dehydratase family protein [Actinomycetota bacterium]
ATKAASEMLCSAYGASFGLAASYVRLTNVYGPGMTEKDSFVPRLMRAAAGGTGVEVYGDGSMLRDYVYISDVADAFLLMIEKAHSGPVVIGSGHSIPVDELIAHARKATGIDIPVEYGDSRPGEMPAVVVDIGRARSLGFTPKVKMDEGMREAWATFSARPPGS